MPIDYGKLFGLTMTVLCFADSFAYFLAGDIRRGLYFFFAGCINTTVVL